MEFDGLRPGVNRLSSWQAWSGRSIAPHCFRKEVAPRKRRPMTSRGTGLIPSVPHPSPTHDETLK